MFTTYAVYGDRNLITHWWVPLQEAGYQLEIKPPLDEEGTPDQDGLVYRSGLVSKERAKVRIITTGALCPRSNHPLSGQAALFMQPIGILRNTSVKSIALANEINEIFINQGLHKLGGFREELERGRRDGTG